MVLSQTHEDTAPSIRVLYTTLLTLQHPKWAAGRSGNNRPPGHPLYGHQPKRQITIPSLFPVKNIRIRGCPAEEQCVEEI
ncbi:hypothetical protein J6590_020755 [Homalodisca vitripennis]|nr:hypothetical protein J6590_020755 [Homalodisca vitripennis]